MILSVMIGTLGGLVVFFIGMILMSRSISSLSNSRLKSFISAITTNPLWGILVGIVVTALLQSSSGTTVLVVGLVNGHVMNLYQAAAVIMGSNIGTTITGQLVTFHFFSIVPHLFMLGIILYYTNIHGTAKMIGKFLIGFSLLFFGMRLMIYFLNPLKSLMGFGKLMYDIEESPFKGMIVGTITTAIIQSSSTSIALLQGLAFQGLITIHQAVPIIMGQNIGTCVTTIISSIPADKSGKRAALIHLIFNILGTLILFPFIHVFSNFVYSLTPTNTVKQIANAHSIFNILAVIIFFPFIKVMVFLSKKIIR